MSSFNGIPFSVVAENTNWFPGVVMDDDGKYLFRCRAWIETISDRRALAKWVSLVTWKRPLGTISTIGHVEAGRGKAKLVIPDQGGTSKQHTAVLVGMTGVQAYGKYANKGFYGDLIFILLSDPMDA